MSRLIHEKIRHYEICELGKETDDAAELHKRRAAECAGAEASLSEFADKRITRVFEKVKAELDADNLTVDEATKIRAYLSLALSEANQMRRTIAQQKLREEGAAAVLGSMKTRLEKKRDTANQKIDAMEAHEAAQKENPDLSVGGVHRGGIMAQRRAERLAEEAAQAKPPAEEKSHADTVAPGATVRSGSEDDKAKADTNSPKESCSDALQAFAAQVGNASPDADTVKSAAKKAAKKRGKKKASRKKTAHKSSAAGGTETTKDLKPAEDKVDADSDQASSGLASQAARRALSAKAKARGSSKADVFKTDPAQTEAS